jgi:hypothetical protein
MERGGGDDGAASSRGGFRWELLAVLMASLLLFLGVQLWRRIRDVDPLQRCASAYENVHTAVDSGLVDGIAVRSPDQPGRTTCGALRGAGRLERLPRRTGPGLLPPRPQPGTR